MSDSRKENDSPMVKTTDDAGLDPIKHPELFFGLVGPVGTDLAIVCSSLQDELAKVGYESTVVRFSRLLHRFPKFSYLKDITHEEQRYEEHMKAGTELRNLFESGDALAQVALLEVGEIRKRHHAEGVADGERLPIDRHAFIFHSLKHPGEVAFFRKVYGKAFSLIAINSLRDKRVNSLSERISNSQFQSDPPHFRANAERLISIDENEEGEKFGQNVRDTFPLADYFIRSDERSDVASALRRFIGLLFNSPFDTPTKSELAMFHAKGTIRLTYQHTRCRCRALRTSR